MPDHLGLILRREGRIASQNPASPHLPQFSHVGPNVYVHYFSSYYQDCKDVLQKLNLLSNFVKLELELYDDIVADGDGDL